MPVHEMTSSEAFRRAHEFLVRVYEAGDVNTYEELLEIYDPDLAVALSSIVTKIGEPNRRDTGQNKYGVRRGLTWFTAYNQARNPDSADPTDVYLEESNRTLGIKRRPATALLSIEGGMVSTSASDTTGNYIPYTARERGDMAIELNSFLRITSHLVRGLVRP